MSLRIAIGGALVVPAFLPATPGWPGEPPAAKPDRQRADESAKAIDWGDVASQVGAALRARDLLTWSDELAAALPGADADTLRTATEVFRRAGQPDRISRALRGLVKASLAGRPGGDWDMVRRLLELGWHEQARLWFDAFPALCPQPADMQAFVNWLVENEGASGAEGWLRGQARRETLRDGFRDSNSWNRLLWDYLAGVGKLEEHVKALAARIERNATDADSVFEYVGAWGCLPEPRRPPAAWLAETARLERALHNFALGQLFCGDEAPEAAVLFFDRSLACPVTDYDRRHFNAFSNWAMYVEPDEAEKHLRRAAKAGLAKACFKTKKLDRAQKLVEELTGKKDGTLNDLGPFHLAGQVQAASGRRVVEGRIITAEAETRESIRYWLMRAQYYRGRKEHDKEEDAYRAALKLPADPADQGHFDAVRDYGWFLARQKRWAEADRVYRDELKRIGPKGANVNFWLNQLQYQVDGNGGPGLAWDEPIIWDWLAAQKDGSFGQDAQMRLQWAAAKAGASERFERKVSALATGPCPPRLQFALGEIYRGRGRAEEGIRMMAEAYARSPRTEWPGDPMGAEQLMHVLLAAGDLAGAGTLLDRLLKEEGYGNNLHRLGAWAVAAARSRAPELAMRAWRIRAGLDLTDLAGLDDLAANGLADRLRDYYETLAKRVPDNAFVRAALKKLPRP